MVLCEHFRNESSLLAAAHKHGLAVTDIGGHEALPLQIVDDDRRCRPRVPSAEMPILAHFALGLLVTMRKARLEAGKGQRHLGHTCHQRRARELRGHVPLLSVAVKHAEECGLPGKDVNTPRVLVRKHLPRFEAATASEAEVRRRTGARLAPLLVCVWPTTPVHLGTEMYKCATGCCHRVLRLIGCRLVLKRRPGGAAQSHLTGMAGR
mmetsp:Transcript_47023/g.135488  ORF Transcript_47023/g.135488 Transcript_47023/m.135488 type:complete len:208 (+) Transcript_47023:959-1582(+)